MTGIDGATSVRLEDSAGSLDLRLAEVFSTSEGEFFVEWQVADLDGPPLPTHDGRAANSL